MKIIVKKLQGGECNLEVFPTTKIREIKRFIAQKLKVSMEQQKLLLMGRTLADDQTVSSYPTIKEGTKLNLVVKKPEGLYEATLKHFKKIGLSDAEATSKASKFVKIVEDKFNKFSWDDLERLSLDCLNDGKGPARAPVNPDTECEDQFGL